MKRNMDWKSWLALIVSMSVLCSLCSHFFGLAHAEDEGYWLDDVDGVVILDDPAYFLDEEVGTSGDLPVESPEAPATQPDETEQPTETPDAAERPTEPTDQPTDTPDNSPADLKELFHVEVKVPSGWRNTVSSTVRIKVTPKGESMWHSLSYRLDDGDWNTLRSKDFTLYDGYYYADIEVSANAKITVRLYGDEANWFDTSKEIRLFDRTSPTVTAGFKDMLLHVEAVDDLSEVAGIQVNGLLFTTLVDGMLDVRMEETLLGYKQLAIRAYDYAGNFSEPVTLDNPYYTEPTPEPTATPKPTTKPTSTKKPSGGSATKKPTATATPTVTAVPQQVVTVTQVPSATTATATTVTETVYVPLGPGQPYTPSGNMQTLDMLYSASTNKQFITVQTRAGETYYLVIDYDKPIDEENEIYETYFLNLVDDRDLMSVVSADEIVATPTPQIVYVTPEPVQSPVQTTPVVVEDDGNTALPVLVLLVGAVVAGCVGFWWVKKQKEVGKARDAFAEEFELEEEEE